MKKRTTRRKKRRHYHTGVHLSPKAGECHYRSGWELSFMLYLDNDSEVMSYLYEGLKIPYLSNVKSGRFRNYLPDMLVTYVDGHRVLYEIKPSRRVNQVCNKKKFDAARTWCSLNDVSFRVMTEIELKENHII